MKRNSLLGLLCMLCLTCYSQTFNSTTTGTVPDNQCPANTDFPIVVTGVGTIGAAKSFAQIEININMAYDGDLDIYLVAPNGTTSIPLSIGEGVSGANFTHTVFRSDGTLILSKGVAPFSGNFFRDFKALNGLSADGTWKVRMCDGGAGDTATFVSASLTFSPTVPVTCAAPIYVTAAEGGVTPTSVHFIWSGGGSLNYFYVLDQSPANPIVSNTSTTAISYDATNLKPETDYYLHVRNDCGVSNGFSTWVTATITTPPVNDACANATNITSLPFNKSQNILGATNNDGFIKACGNGMNDGVWYVFNVTNGGNMTIDVSGVTDWNPEVAVYSGNCGNFTCVSSADTGGVGIAESLSLNSLKPGQYWINVGDDSGTVDNLEGPLNISVMGTVALGAVVLGAESFDKGNFSYYPNPVRNKLNLSYSRNISNMTIYNLLGQQVMEKTINASSSQVDISALSSGTYVVKVSADGQIQSFKVIKE